MERTTTGLCKTYCAARLADGLEKSATVTSLRTGRSTGGDIAAPHASGKGTPRQKGVRYFVVTPHSTVTNQGGAAAARSTSQERNRTNSQSEASQVLSRNTLHMRRLEQICCPSFYGGYFRWSVSWGWYNLDIVCTHTGPKSGKKRRLSEDHRSDSRPKRNRWMAPGQLQPLAPWLLWWRAVEGASIAQRGPLRLTGVGNGGCQHNGPEPLKTRAEADPVQ